RETRAISSCCTLTPHCQSFALTPHPCSAAGLTSATLLPVLPKFRLLPVTAPHVSRPAPLCAAGLRMSQSTTKLPLSSDQLRGTLVTIFVVCAGLLSVYRLSFVAGAR